MAVRMMETLRRRTSVVAATGALAGAALAVSGCGGSSESGSTAGDVASFVPAGSPVYLEVTTALDGPQWQQVSALAKLFPSYPELRKMIDSSLQNDKVNFDRDVKPLLGDRAAIGVLSIPSASLQTATLANGGTAAGAAAAKKAANDAPVVAAVDIAKGKASTVTDLIVKGGATKLGQHDGVDVYGKAGDPTVAAVDDGALVIANRTADLYAALDAHQAGGDKTLAGQSRFKDALAKLPADVFGQAYVDVGALVREASASSPQLGQLGLGNVKDAVVAASVAAEPDGARLKGVVLNAPKVATTGFTPTLADHAPADAVAYLGFDNLAGTVSQILTQARAAQSSSTQQQFDALSAQLPQLLGVSTRQLADLASGEHAVVVTGGANPGAVLALKVKDGAAAQATLDKLRVGVPGLLKTFSPKTKLPAWQQVPLAVGVQGWRLPLSPKAGLVYGVDGTTALVGSSATAVAAVQRPAAPLSASSAFQAATSGMPSKVTSVFWLDVQRAVETAKAGGAFKKADAKALANLKPLKSVSAWTTGGDQPTFEVFLHVAK